MALRTEDADATARLIERLLADPGFRATFRHDPAQACRDAGLDELADEMALGVGKAMQTLDERESMSSLAGVLMAAAMEGVAFVELSDRLVPHLEEIPHAIGDVLSRVNLPALPGGGALASTPAADEMPAAATALPADPLAALSGPDAPGAPSSVAEATSGPAGAPPEEDAPDAPEPLEDAPATSGATAAPDETDGGAEADTAEDGGGGAPVDEPVAGGPPLDAAEFGAEGTGGEPSPEAKALLENDKVILDSVGVADIEAGRIDPRVVSVLTKLSQDHEITVSCICSDHSKLTAGGSISNHHLGRGLDIAAIDGVPVNSSSFDAREVAENLIELDPAIRPDEIGSPWQIGGPGSPYFTDAGHQDHLHVGFKTEIDPGWRPPADVAAGGAAPGGGAGITPGVPGEATGGARVAAGDTLGFEAVAADRRANAAGSMVFAALAPSAPMDSPGVVDGGGGGGGGPDLSGVADGYPGDKAPIEERAAWLAKLAEKRGLPPELPVMAALVESGVENLPGGHADSVGYFQMRLSVWNKGEWAGYPDKPALQAKWFLDTAEQVKSQRVSRGLPIDDPKQYGEWIADVERPAAEFRFRYQEQLEKARGLLAKAGEGGSAPEANDAASAVTDQPAARAAALASTPPDGGQEGGGSIQGTVSDDVEIGSRDSMAFAAVESPESPKQRSTVQFLQAIDPALARSGSGPGSPLSPTDPDAIADAAGGGGQGAAAMVRFAQGEVGQREAPSGSNDSPRIAVYRGAVPGGPVGPWCAYFSSWAAKEAGVPLGDNGQGFAAVDDVWAWGERTGRATPSGPGVTPRPGDLIVWDEHIGVVEKVAPDGTIHTIEGNSSDGVNRRTYEPGGPIIGFVRPGK